jgi:hypothetical protein
MSHRANFNNSYLLRYILIAVGSLAWAGWCAYDGFVKAPQQLEYAREFEKLKDLDETARSKKWKEITEEKGWPFKRPKKPEKVEHFIQWQYFMGSIALLIGLPMLFLFLVSRGSWIEMTDGGLTTSWKQNLQYDDILTIDKTKWEKKGIAKIFYEENGRRKIFVLDDFKYERKTVGEMLRQAEAGLDNEQIIGGKPESQKTPESKSEIHSEDSPEQ